MAHGTILIGIQVVRGFAGGNHAVMARFAAARDTRMVKYAVGESARGVTNTAVEGRGHMVVRLAQCGGIRRVVVTTIATSSSEIDHRMVNVYYSEISCVMAHAAIRRGVRMIVRFKDGAHATIARIRVMAIRARSSDVAVVEERDRGKRVRGMTQAAVPFGGIVVLSLAFTHDAVVANGAIALNTGVVILSVGIQLHKTRGVMAGIAFNIGGHVFGGLAYGYNAVVADAALAQHFGVVDIHYVGECQRCYGRVTGFARVAGGGVVW